MTAAELRRLLSKADLIGVLDLIDTALSVGTEEQFCELIRHTARLVPIEYAHVSVAELDGSDAIVGTTRRISVDFPEEWLTTYRDRRLMDIDPAARLLFKTEKPLIWDDLRQRYQRRGDQAFYRMAHEFGLDKGFSFGARFLRSSSGSFFSCAGRDLTSEQRHILIIRYLLPHLNAALSKVHLGLLKQAPDLTKREIEVLNWAKFGKTNWEISLQMNCSERGVKFHLHNAMRKLNASNRSQAIAIALSQGLIEWG
jgi:DNA-binding CsgD family transcriptional regulator